MLSRHVVAGLLPLCFASSVFAQAACPCGAGVRVVDPALTPLLAGNTVCAAVGSETWQEFHSGNTAAGGQLIDYKRGPGDAVDPTAVVGSWSVVPEAGSRSGSVVRYQYNDGSSYLYSVCQAAGSVTFCGAATGGRNITGATLKAGQVPCN